MINKARQYLTFLNENEDDDSTTEYTDTNIKDIYNSQLKTKEEEITSIKNAYEIKTYAEKE